jgi:spore photoproduct lyase
LRTLYIERAVKDLPVVKSICSQVNAQILTADDPHEMYRRISASPDPIQAGKDILYLCRNKGAFIRQCPGTRHYTCCGYKILHVGTFCHMDCAYCILQAYFHPPVLQYFVNHDEMLKELAALFQTNSICRIGTGEFTDSMIWELWTDLSEKLIPFFAGQQQAILELKTKTTAIERLRHLPHNRKTICSWSLNSPKVISSEERGTASLEARLKAASKCQSWGYPLAFHFDPMIIYEGCESDYMMVIEKLFSHILADNIAWISLGTFRFMPALKSIIQKRFPKSKIIYGEFVPGLDNKMRYFKPLRINLYKKVAAVIKSLAPEVLVYFCMEDEEVWHKALGYSPADRGGLPRILDERAAYLCQLKLGANRF